MDWKRLQNISLAVVASITGVVVVGTLYVIFLAWFELEPPQRASIAITGLGAVGTLFLATATFWTVLHNTRQMEERERESEKPLARNEVVHLIQPAIDALRNNIECLEDEFTIDWFYYDPSRYHSFPSIGIRAAGEPTPIISTKDPHALVRLEEERPKLYREMKAHDDILNELARQADEISEAIDRPLRQFIKEHDLESVFNDKSDFRTLKSAILKEIDRYGENHDHYDAWSKYRDEFLDILYSAAGNEFGKLNELEAGYRNLCERLLEKLVRRKVGLQEEYGFVVEDEDESPTKYR